jgi:hypothetical protein
MTPIQSQGDEMIEIIDKNEHKRPLIREPSLTDISDLTVIGGAVKVEQMDLPMRFIPTADGNNVLNINLADFIQQVDQSNFRNKAQQVL